MFLPYIPYLILLACLTALLAAPPVGMWLGGNGGAELAPGMEAGMEAGLESGWELGLGFLALALLGGIIGNLPQRWLERSKMSGGLRRRAIFMGVWLGSVAVSGMPHSLASFFDRLAAGALPGPETALALLMFNYWVGEALALDAFNPWDFSTLGAQVRRLGWRMRLPGPILVVILAGLALPILMQTFMPPDAERHPLGGGWWSILGSLLAMAAIAGLAVPLLMRACWGLRPLPEGALNSAVRDELQANGVKVANVLAWPDALMGFATAGVVGVLPPFRYLLFSPTLGARLTEDEVRAVTAHEAGHLRHGHLWFLMLALLGFVLLAQGATTGLLMTGLMTGWEIPLWLLVVGEVAALLIFLRFGLGFLSRNFERQADGQAVRRTGTEHLASALNKLALLNGIPLERTNWHHYGIVQRVGFFQEEADPNPRLADHDRRVRKIKAGVAVFFALALGLQALTASETATVFVGEKVLAGRLARVEQPGPEHLGVMQFLASQAYARDDLLEAEHYFRLILAVTPDDPTAQNNLAWVLVTRPQAAWGELDEGLRLARAAASNTDEAYIWDTLAESYFRLNRMEEAYEASGKALAQAQAGVGRGSAPLGYYQGRVERFGENTPNVR